MKTEPKRIQNQFKTDDRTQPAGNPYDVEKKVRKNRNIEIKSKQLFEYGQYKVFYFCKNTKNKNDVALFKQLGIG